MTPHDHDSPAPSTAAVASHPIHPMLVPFPIAFLAGALCTDLAYWGTGDAFWARGSFWLLAAGLVTGVVAAVFGLTDFVTIERARSHLAGWVHLVGNAAALLLAVVTLVMRWGDAAAGVLPWGVVFTAVITGLLVVTGWYGGELSYRHRIGMIEAEKGGKGEE